MATESGKISKTPPVKYLRAADIADELGVSLNTARVIARQCGCIVFGRVIRVARGDFDAWLESHTVVQREAPSRYKPPVRSAPYHGLTPAAVKSATPVRATPPGFVDPILRPVKSRRRADALQAPPPSAAPTTFVDPLDIPIRPRRRKPLLTSDAATTATPSPRTTARAPTPK